MDFLLVYLGNLRNLALFQRYCWFCALDPTPIPP